MKRQHEAVIEVMKENGGYSTLGHLYKNSLNIPNVEWKTKTPFASIRRIVQDERFFFKIKSGLWALNEYRDKLPIDILCLTKKENSKIGFFNHTYYQGLLVEIGNLKKFKTFIPPQDKNRKYLNTSLGEIATLKKIITFSFGLTVRKTATIDVVWFNERDMPNSFFEVEHSTNIQNSLLKFLELQDFHTDFFIVADKVRQKEFISKITLSAFRPIQKRVKFINYTQVSAWHTKVYEISILENAINF